jgi:hypothetical protein
MALFIKDRIEENTSVIYGEGFRKVHAVFVGLQHDGHSHAATLSKMLTYVRQHKELPVHAAKPTS